MPNFTKYILRFGLIFIIAAPVLYFTQGAVTMKLIAYKLGLSALAVGFAELIWAIFFVPVFGKSERINDEKKFMGLMLFRGLLYAAIILALTLGL